MEKVGKGRYRYAFPMPLALHEPLEYKYVKGGWEAEELGADGYAPVNRRMEVPRGKVADVVPQWKCHENWYDPRFYPDIQIVSRRFNVPQLRRRRRIAVLLPHDYRTSGKRYPVLYLQDGQNLFEDGAPFGTWGVDKQLALMAQRGVGDFIVVAIDHGGKERIKEFLPYESPRWGEGMGRAYAAFLAETLKPYIDQEYRTLSDRAHTGIGGSSMGGLISIYAGLQFPHVFSRFMIFSPSLWISPRLYFEPLTFAHQGETRIYLYMGGREGQGMLAHAESFHAHLQRGGAKPTGHDLTVRFAIDPEGKHTESRWGHEFPKAAEWLFAPTQG
jgi:predicted alpha/beta superfamily hydrolase